MNWDKEYKGGAHYIKDEPSKGAKKFIGLLHKGDKVLEIGCGGGEDTKFFKEKGFDTTSIDLSREAAKDVPNTLVANAEELPFKDSAFDAVFTLNTLQFTDMNKSVHEINRVLKKGGFVFIVLVTRTVKQGKEKKNKQNIKEIIEKEGFEIIKEKEGDKIDEKGNKNEHLHTLSLFILKKR